jgi:hypothetical protein
VETKGVFFAVEIKFFHFRNSAEFYRIWIVSEVETKGVFFAVEIKFFHYRNSTEFYRI